MNEQNQKEPKPPVKELTEKEKSEIEANIGKAIVAGLLSPMGIIGTTSDDTSRYQQQSGGYWQTGGSHAQGSGDYHQQEK